MNIKITINNKSGTSIDTHQWEIIGEDERVSVSFGGREYSLVLNKINPLIEVWSLTQDGELDNLIREIPLNG